MWMLQTPGYGYLLIFIMFMLECACSGLVSEDQRCIFGVRCIMMNAILISYLIVLGDESKQKRCR